MSSYDEFEELQDTTFEDEMDFLEYAYEKIEAAVYIWTLWVKAFVDNMDEEVSRKLLTEFAENIHKDVFFKLQPLIDEVDGEKILHGYIRRFQMPNTQDDPETPEESL